MKSEWKDLPIYKYEQQIVDKIKNNQVVILSGETGCGKTTQVPKIIHSHFGKNKKIAVTQPRRISCLGVAQRVAQELGVSIPNTVGIDITT
jgi:HrpA-like RNA helicase